MESPTVVFAYLRGHHFWARPIAADSFVLDLGANHGGFAADVHDRFGCVPRLVEANPDLYQDLAADPRFPVAHCAVTGQNGSVTFNIARNDEGSSVLPLPDTSAHDCVHVRAVTVPAMTLDAVVSHFGLDHLDLLKMDIEGAEIAVLETCPASMLQRIGQITVEFHCDPCYGLYAYDRVAAVARRLESCGFTRYDFGSRFTDVLFVNHAHLKSSLASRAGLRFRNRCHALLKAAWNALPGPRRHSIRNRLKVGRTT